LAARGTEISAKRSLPTIKLDSYDGSSSTPLQTHLPKLSNFASYYNWGPRDRLCHLKASIVGQAGEVVWQLTDESTEADVVRLLSLWIRSSNRKLQARITDPLAKAGKSIQSSYHDVHHLLALSFSGQSGDPCELLGMDYFLSALAEPAFHVRVLDQ